MSGEGVWVAYHHDMGTFADAVFADEIDALRFAVGSGYLNVTFWPFGVELNDALTDGTPRTTPASIPAGGNPGGNDG